MFLQGGLWLSLSHTQQTPKRYERNIVIKHKTTVNLLFSFQKRNKGLQSRQEGIFSVLADRCFTKMLKYDFRIYCGKT